MPTLLTLTEARDQIVISNQLDSLSVGTVRRWARKGYLPVTRIGRGYAVDAFDAINFRPGESVPRQGNPGKPRPKCEHGVGRDRCLKTARWVVMITASEGQSLVRCDEHRLELQIAAHQDEAKFKIVNIRRLKRSSRTQ